MRAVVRRIAVVLVIGGVAALCVSSSMLSTIVGGLTVAFVLIDMSTQAPRPERAARRSMDLTPQKITIDLDRRG